MHLRFPPTLAHTAMVLLAAQLIACSDSDDGSADEDQDGGVDGGTIIIGADGGILCDLSIDSDDCDGDGRTNAQEKRGYDIQIDTSGFGLEDLSLLEERHVTSDPVDPDTDGDGLDDGEEFIGRSDPGEPDTDGDDLNDFEEVTRWRTSAVSVDTDGDARSGDSAPNPALFDGAELALEEDADGEMVPGPRATSPNLADTDGDGVDDTEEIDSAVRTAVVADLPQVGIELSDDVSIFLNVVYDDASSTTRDYGSTFSSSSTSELSVSDGTSLGVSAELSTTVGAEAEVGVPPSVTASASVTATVGIEASFSTEITRSTAEELGHEYSQSQSDSVETSVSTESGSLAVGITISNVGEIAYHLDNLGIAVRQFVATENRVRSLTVLPLPDGLEDGFTLAPGNDTGSIPFSVSDLPVDLVKSFLRNPSSLIFQPVGFDLKNADGTSFTFLTEATFERTALVVVDSGKGEPTSLRLATNVNRTAEGDLAGIKLGRGLTDAEIEYETEESTNGLQVLTAIGNDTVQLHDDEGPDMGDPDYPEGLDPGPRTARRFWAIFGGRDGGSIDFDVDFEDIVVEHGDELRLVYVRDDDQDGISDREEYLRGSSDDTPHSDGDGTDNGDGLSDWFEIKVGWDVTTAGAGLDTYHVYSSPALIDTDGDGLTDFEEYELGTDPGSADTDLDGAGDATDVTPLEFHLNSAPVFDSISITGLTDTVTVMASVSDEDDNLDNVTIEWGDGSADTVISSGFASIDVDHTYADSGEYTITVTALDEDGAATVEMETLAASAFPNDPVLYLTLNGNTSNTGSDGALTIYTGGVIDYVGDRKDHAAYAADLYDDNNSGSGGRITTSNLTLGTDFTMAAWILHNGTYGNDVVFFGQGDWFSVYSESSKVGFGLVTGAGGVEPGDDPFEMDTLPTGVWRFYVGVVEQTGADESTSSFYVNGAFVGSEVFNSLQTSPTTCRFGTGTPPDSGDYCSATNPSDVVNNFNGVVDDVRVYRRALSAAEIAILYAE